MTSSIPHLDNLRHFQLLCGTAVGEKENSYAKSIVGLEDLKHCYGGGEVMGQGGGRHEKNYTVDSIYI